MGLLCLWTIRELGISMTELSRRLNLSLSGVSQSIARDEKLVEINRYNLLNEKL
jgi:DNA-binding MarR family transcriptional regulator